MKKINFKPGDGWEFSYDKVAKEGRVCLLLWKSNYPSTPTIVAGFRIKK